MSISVPWPAIGSILAGLLSLYFIRYLWPYRDDSAARFFIGTIACETLWALSYGVALLVFDPSIRPLFEIPNWIGINFIGVFFLAFALEYTGRGQVVRSKFMAGIVAIQGLHTAVVVTNPIHHLAWSNYHIDPAFGASTVSYTHQPWLFVNFVGIYVMVAGGSLLLLEAFYSYGPLYRVQTAAIGLSPVLPGIAFTLWLFEIGISPPLNLTPLTFPIHIGLDMVAFFKRNIFEMTPAARRAGDRAAVDDLGSPVIILDDRHRVINVNQEAKRVFSTDGGLIGRDLEAAAEGVDPSMSNQVVTVVTDEGVREFAVNVSSLDNAGGDTIGYTLVFQDITEEKRREQRLTVLNRVLRHNLRNDMNVVHGNVDIAADRVVDDGLEEILTRSKLKAEDVIELGEKARRIDQLLNVDSPGSQAVDARQLLEEVRDDLLADDSAARISIEIPDGLRFRGDRQLLWAVFENLVENAIVHNDSDEPRVTIGLSEDDGHSRLQTFEIRDNGPGIPDIEVSTIESGDETALQHGSGLGLWLVKWGVASLGGSVEYSTTDTGTIVHLRLPVATGD